MGRNISETEIKKLKYLMSKIEPVKESEGFDAEFKRKLNEEIQKTEGPAPIGLFREFVLSPVFNIQKAATVLATIFVITISWHFYYIQGFPVVTSVSGQAEIASGAGWQKLAQGAHIKKGMILQAKANSQIDIQLNNMYSVRLKPNTTLAIKQLAMLNTKGKTIFELKEGRALVQIEDGFKPKEFIIDTPTASASALGTAFMVDFAPQINGKTWLGVLSGRVEVENKFAKVFVNAGEKTTAQKDKAPASPQRLLQNEWKMLTEIYQIGQQQKVVLLIGIGHDRVKELLKPAAIVIYGKKSKAIPAALKEAVNDINEALKQNDNNMHIQAIRKLESVARDYPDPKQDMQLLLFIGAYYEYLNQHKDAIKTFNQALAKYPDSSFASLALCATAVIYEKDLHNPASARAIYNKVAAKYPSSPEAEYANSQLIKIQ